ncbi:MAG: fluoride efflux transporter CrcB [Candidatus Binatia bacterium]
MGWEVLWVALGGSIGAVVRYVLGVWIGSRIATVFPFATFLINVTGSAALGLLIGTAESRGLPPFMRPLVAVGFLGAYTTFSTFSYETLRLAEAGNLGTALLYAGASLVTGLAAALAGLGAGRLL